VQKLQAAAGKVAARQLQEWWFWQRLCYLRAASVSISSLTSANRYWEGQRVRDRLPTATCSMPCRDAALVSRQYMDMSRIRIEGLLAAFPKLVGTGKQHTYVETESIRYIYQPLEVRAHCWQLLCWRAQTSRCRGARSNEIFSWGAF
jgi:hypothetical protein